MNSDFSVVYIANTNIDSFNPYFPAIYITTGKKHNAWLQVVRTDSEFDNGKYELFIDSCLESNSHYKEYYPFYVMDYDFSDTPHWSYTPLYKPLTYWKAHAYAVQVDRQAKTIQCIGGIFWGFKLSYWFWKPIAYKPVPLTLQDWQKYWDVFKSALPEYNCI